MKNIITLKGTGYNNIPVRLTMTQTRHKQTTYRAVREEYRKTGSQIINGMIEPLFSWVPVKQHLCHWPDDARGLVADTDIYSRPEIFQAFGETPPR